MYMCLYPPSYFRYLTLRKNVCFKPVKPTVQQPKNQFNQRHFVHNTTNNTSAHTSLKNTNTIIPPRPPALASSDFKLIGECDWPMSHSGAQSPQHGDAIFNSLTAMVAYLRPLFFELRASLLTFRIFVR